MTNPTELSQPLPYVRPFVPRNFPLQRGPLFKTLPDFLRRFLDQAADAHSPGQPPYRCDLLFFGHHYALVRLPSNPPSGHEGSIVQLRTSHPNLAAVHQWGVSRKATEAEDDAIAAVADADVQWVAARAAGKLLRERATELAAAVQQQLEVILRAVSAGGGSLLYARDLEWAVSLDDIDHARAEAAVLLRGHHVRLCCEITPQAAEPRWVVESVHIPLEPALAADPLAVLRQVARLSED